LTFVNHANIFYSSKYDFCRIETFESINRQIKKIIKNKGVFPTDESIKKIIYLALRNAAKKWSMPIRNWQLALNQFEVLCGDFRQDLLEHKK